jgi:hypothetical protein
VQCGVGNARSRKDLPYAWILDMCVLVVLVVLAGKNYSQYCIVSVQRRKKILIGGNAKCRHLKWLTFKGTLRQVFIRVYRLEIQSVTVAPLTFSLVQLSPPSPPSLCELVYCIHARGGLWGSRTQTDKHLPQSPFKSQPF